MSTFGSECHDYKEVERNSGLPGTSSKLFTSDALGGGRWGDGGVVSDSLQDSDSDLRFDGGTLALVCSGVDKR